jgi:hypothetical protein
MYLKIRGNYEKFLKTKNDLDDFVNIDLMHELRQKMIKEFKTSSKDLTPDQKQDKIIEVRDQFLPEKKKNLLESSNINK